MSIGGGGCLLILQIIPGAMLIRGTALIRNSRVGSIADSAWVSKVSSFDLSFDFSIAN